MRLLSVGWECPEGYYGGLGTVVSRLLPALADAGAEALHVCTEGAASGCVSRARYRYCRFAPTLVTKDMGVYVSTAIALGYHSMLLLGAFDAVLGHDIHGSLAVIAASEAGVRSALFVHMVSYSGVEAEACRAATVVITNSRLSARTVREAYGVEPRVVYLPPPYPLQTVDEGKFRRDGVPTILILTRYQPNKDPGWVLRLLDELYRAGRRFRVVLAGRATELYGYDYPWLTTVGTVDEETKLRLLREADLLVYPSVWEPYGLPPLEAIALGTPALVSRGAGVAEVLTGRELIDPDDPKRTRELLDAYISSARDREELLRLQRGLPIVRRSWTDVAREILALL